MGVKDCPSFDRCSAPLCPLHAEWLEQAVWTPGEELCVRQRHPGGTPRWLRVQRRLARRLAGVEDAGLFSVRMLERIGLVTSATRGLSPDVPDWPAAEAAWCRGHKPIPARVLSEAQREQVRNLRPGVKNPPEERSPTTSDAERDPGAMSRGEVLGAATSAAQANGVEYPRRRRSS